MSINNCTFSGRLTKDPELKIVTIGGKEVDSCTFSLAVDKGYGDNKRAIFPRFEAWRHDAKHITDYGKKGQEVTVVCEYDMRQDKADDKKFYHSFVVRNLQLHRGLKSEDGSSKASTRETKKEVPSVSPQEDYKDGEDDDDLPF